MEVIRTNREPEQIDPEARRESFEECIDPLLAVM
jgi:hypothetical protein